MDPTAEIRELEAMVGWIDIGGLLKSGQAAPLDHAPVVVVRRL
jgi:hypothetical protein